MNAKIRWNKLVFSSCLLLLLSSCRADRPASETRLRVGYIPIADSSQLFLAIEKGYLASHKIVVAPVSMAGGAPILEALGAHSLDVGFSNIVSLILAHDAGLPFVALTGGPSEDRDHAEHAILVSATSPIKRIEDLKGKTIALNTRKNIDELMVTTLLKRHGVSPLDVKFTEVPFPRMLSVLAKGDVAAAAAIEPFVTIGSASGAAKVLSYNYIEVQESTPISTYVVDRNWLQANRDSAVGFSSAIEEATSFARSKPSEVRVILARYTKIDPSYLSRVVLPAFNPSLSERELQLLIDQVYDMGWIHKKFNAAEILAEKPHG